MAGVGGWKSVHRAGACARGGREEEREGKENSEVLRIAACTLRTLPPIFSMHTSFAGRSGTGEATPCAVPLTERQTRGEQKVSSEHHTGDEGRPAHHAIRKTNSTRFEPQECPDLAACRSTTESSKTTASKVDKLDRAQRQIRKLARMTLARLYASTCM